MRNTIWPVRFSGGPCDGKIVRLSNVNEWIVPLPINLIEQNPLLQEEAPRGVYRHESFLDEPELRVFVWNEVG